MPETLLGTGYVRMVRREVKKAVISRLHSGLAKQRCNDFPAEAGQCEASEDSGKTRKDGRESH